jgi:hypothetical protein
VGSRGAAADKNANEELLIEFIDRYYKNIPVPLTCVNI